MKKNPVPILIIALAVIIFFGALLLLQLYSNKSRPDDTGTKGTLTIAVTPTSGTKIVVNGRGVTEGTISLDPGSYTVEASREGFEPSSKQVTVTAGKNTNVGIALASNSPTTENWYETHLDDSSKADGMVSAESEQVATAQMARYPIFARLPFTAYGQYLIDHGLSEKYPDDPAAAAIYIDYNTEADKQAALNWIKYQGYDPNDFEIIFKQGLSQ